MTTPHLPIEPSSAPGAPTPQGGHVPPRERVPVPRTLAGVEARIRTLTTQPMRRGLVATGGAVALALASLVHPWLVALTMVALQVWFATGWMQLLGLPSVRRGGIVIALVGVAAVGGSIGTRDPQQLVLALAAGLICAFLVQMSRDDGRPRLVEDVSGIVGGAVAVTCGAGWVFVADHHPVLTLAAACALAAAAAVGATRWAGRTVMLAGSLVAALAAVLGGALAVWLLPVVGLTDVPLISGPVSGLVALVVLGLGIGLVTTTLHVLLTWLPSSGRRRPAAAAALLPVLLIGVPLELVRNLLV